MMCKVLSPLTYLGFLWPPVGRDSVSGLGMLDLPPAVPESGLLSCSDLPSLSQRPAVGSPYPEQTFSQVFMPHVPSGTVVSLLYPFSCMFLSPGVSFLSISLKKKHCLIWGSWSNPTGSESPQMDVSSPSLVKQLSLVSKAFGSWRSDGATQAQKLRPSSGSNSGDFPAEEMVLELEMLPET